MAMRNRWNQKQKIVEDLPKYEGDLPIPVGAEKVKKEVIKKYRQRVRIARIITDKHLDTSLRRHCRDLYCSETQVTARTVRRYGQIYEEKGPEALFFSKKYHKRAIIQILDALEEVKHVFFLPYARGSHIPNQDDFKSHPCPIMKCWPEIW